MAVKTFSNTSLSIGQIIKQLQKKNLVANQDYQRKIVWHDKGMQRDLIRSIILGMPMGTIVVWRTTDENGYAQGQIVDGQQRLKTIETFILGRNIKCNKEDEQKDIWIDIDTWKAIIKDQEIANEIRNRSREDLKAKILLEKELSKIYYNDLPDFLIDKIDQYPLNITEIYRDDEKFIRDYFKILQNQEKLKAGEIINSFSESDIFIKKHLTQLEIEKMCEIINFKDNRRDFTKHFCVFVGIVLNKIRMGLPDKNIVALISKIQNEDLNKSLEFLKIRDKLKNEISMQSEYKNTKKTKALSKLGLKLLLLSYLFTKESKYTDLPLSEKSEIMIKIKDIAGYWNSKNVETKKHLLKEKFKKNDEENYENLFNGVEQSWLLGKTTHSKKEIEEKFEKINFLINFLIENKDFNIKV